MSDAKNKIVTTIVLMVLAAAVVLAGFYKLTNNSKKASKDSVPATEVERLLLKDIDNKYPGTPREVLKLYSRINQCLINDKLKEKQVEGLCDQLRLLFDEKLLLNNPKEKHYEDLKAEIDTYAKAEKTITSHTVEKSSNVEYKTIDKVEYATIVAEFLVKEKSKYVKTYEKFILARDDKKRWKIVGWKTISEKEAQID